MKRLIVRAGLLAGFLLTGCAQAGKAVETYLSYKGKVTDKVVEGTVLTAKTYCATQVQSERAKYRDWFADKADADPATEGLRLEVTCPGD